MYLFTGLLKYSSITILLYFLPIEMKIDKLFKNLLKDVWHNH